MIYEHWKYLAKLTSNSRVKQYTVVLATEALETGLG